MDQPTRADRLVVVVSDVEIGAGGVTDDFPQSEALGKVLLETRQRTELPIDFVFNGDTFDFLKTRVSGRWPLQVTADLAVAKLVNIMRAHEAFFTALSTLASSAETRLHFIVGNHDPELVFEQVQRVLRRRLGGSTHSVNFPGFTWRFGDLHIEHGSQADPLFRVDPTQPFGTHRGRPMLALPWGSVAILEVAMPMQPVLYHFDRVKPRDVLIEQVPELQDLLTGLYYQYWKEHGTGWLLGDDPLKKLSWSAFKEILYRFGTRDLDVSFGDHFRKMVSGDGPIKVAIGGHTHCPSLWTKADRRVLTTGCWRNEFVMEGDRFEPLPRVHAHVWMHGERTLHATLVEHAAPPIPKGYVPRVHKQLPKLRELLGEGDLDGVKRAWTLQETLDQTLG